MMKIRKAYERGQGNFDWLKARYTFSFSSYYDPEYMGFSDLLVMNEDEISASKGFETHSHKDMEIITFVTEGALGHKDSMGNTDVVRPGEIQFMSAGTGIRHSEFNELNDSTTKLLQIWIKPDKLGHKPNYGQMSYLDKLKPNKLCLIASGDAREESLKINQDAEIYTAKLDKGKTINYQSNSRRKIWVQVISGALILNDQELNKGDGVAIEQIELINMKATLRSEFLLFNLR